MFASLSNMVVRRKNLKERQIFGGAMNKSLKFGVWEPAQEVKGSNGAKPPALGDFTILRGQ